MGFVWYRRFARPAMGFLEAAFRSLLLAKMGAHTIIDHGV
jgi:hypothetical protein